MKNFFIFLLDTILPPHEDVVAVRTITEPLTPRPQKIVINNIAVTTLLPYKNTTVGACIRAVKYHHHKRASELLAGMLRTYAYTIPPETIIIPIPLSLTRFKNRGHNQVETILKAACIPYQSGVLVRTERSTQTTLARKERLKNTNGAMSVVAHKAPFLEGKNVLIIDDVVTTGATLAEAGRAIAIARPACVQYLALAH